MRAVESLHSFTFFARARALQAGTESIVSGDRRPIAVFDSGLGGLTVVRALRKRLPHEDIVYFGDTARVPYGSKTRETVLRFSRENCSFLQRLDPKCFVAACNTVSAVCLPDLESEVSAPVFGVVRPGARAAVEESGDRDFIAVIATEATVASNAYQTAIHALDPDRAVVQVACPLFVPLVEEGLDESDPIVTLTIERYLRSLALMSPASVVLGCTHYPMLRRALAAYLGTGVRLVDSGGCTADAVAQRLASLGALSPSSSSGSLHFYVSDHPKRFQTVGSRFLGEPILDVVRVCTEELSAIGSRYRAGVGGAGVGGAGVGGAGVGGAGVGRGSAERASA
jgi:glutamate racemase